jgi:hypothetical protein
MQHGLSAGGAPRKQGFVEGWHSRAFFANNPRATSLTLSSSSESELRVKSQMLPTNYFALQRKAQLESERNGITLTPTEVVDIGLIDKMTMKRVHVQNHSGRILNFKAEVPAYGLRSTR